MEDRELIAKISHLKEIQPRGKWVLLTRQRLIGEDLPRTRQSRVEELQKEPFWGIVARMARMVAYMERPAFVIPSLALIVAAGAVGMGVADSLPGDRLYSLRAAIERVPFKFAAQEEEQIFPEFELAKQRLADLRVVAEQNKVKNLPVAIQEFEANASRISEDFLLIVENQPEKALQASRQIVELQKAKSEVEKILGTKIGEEHEDEIKDATKQLVEYELAYLETRSLTDEQKELFETAKGVAGAGDYAAALEHIWNLSQNITQEG